MKPTLNKKYCIGTHVMFYEIEMFTDYINGLINILETIDNKENVMFDFYLNTNEHLEQIDTSKILKDDIVNKFLAEMGRLSKVASSPIFWNFSNGEMFFHTDYRRDSTILS